MRLAFYYHIPMARDGSALRTDGALGCFLDSIAARVEELVLLMHEESGPAESLDYTLKAENVRLVSLGAKRHPVVRTFLGSFSVTRARAELAACDALLLRSPTHLFGAWSRLCRDVGTQLIPLIVGDYRAGNYNLAFSFPKKQLVQGLNWAVDSRQQSLLAGQPVLVNSRVLADKYTPIAGQVHEVRTSTLSQESFHERADTCLVRPVNILYTGRFEWQKGLRELLEAFTILVNQEGIDATLNFAGWQPHDGPSIEDEILQSARESGINERVIFHGKKSVGAELDRMYRMADIYVMPSWAEGFPRTIWEAMANSLPVIATKVGSIPIFTEDGKHALHVERRSPAQIVAAVLRLLDDEVLRQGLIRHGRALAESNTLESQAALLVDLLSETLLATAANEQR